MRALPLAKSTQCTAVFDWLVLQSCIMQPSNITIITSLSNMAAAFQFRQHLWPFS